MIRALNTGYLIMLPLLLLAGLGPFFTIFPETAAKPALRRRGAENDPETAGRIRRRFRTAGVILLCAAFLLEAAVTVLIWTGQIG